HQLDQAVFGDHFGHLSGVILGHRKEQRFLVAEVMEDRAPREPDLCLESPHGRAFVAVARERATGAVDDRATAGLEVVRGEPGHGQQTTEDVDSLARCDMLRAAGTWSWEAWRLPHCCAGWRGAGRRQACPSRRSWTISQLLRRRPTMRESGLCV